MKSPPLATVLILTAAAALAHDSKTGEAHTHYDRSTKPPELIFAQAPASPRTLPVRSINPTVEKQPAQVAAFEKFAPAVNVRWDQKFLFVESNGMPAHKLMVGITAWQQQVPLPQNYKGANAWQIPLSPIPAKEVISIKNRFLRGAIALAANGIPIFNPQNNRGEISAEIGELDEWGGHCGRGDDYHYHAAPLHLQSVLGKGLPVAYALDGYPIYGLTEPDGSQPGGLDAFNGHTTAALGYHYHASTKYPYVNGGFHGEVIERDGQVEPQPRAQPVRPSLPALRGAKITGFEVSGANGYNLVYEVNGEKRSVAYALNADGTFSFEFQNGRDGVTKETYTRREGGGGQGGPRSEGERRGGPRMREEERPRGDKLDGPRPRGGTRDETRASESGSRFSMDAMKKPNAAFTLSSPAIGTDGRLPIGFTGDGMGVTPPLTWKGAPVGTRSFALVMDHLAPGDVVKSYWTMWEIPANMTSLQGNVSGVGKVGSSYRGAVGYEPPHSQGPGEKTYVITIYALSASPQLSQAPREVTRDVLLEAIKDSVIASASLNVVYSRDVSQAREERPKAQFVAAESERPPERRRTGEGKGRSKGGPPGLTKPSTADTIKLNVYADNWFILYVNNRLVAVDPIQFTPHNVVSVDFLPEYPMTIAVLAKDNADPKTGMEYGTSIGDGGFVLKFGDGTVTNATWKTKSFFRGPLGGDTANPKVEETPLPANWWAVDFDDSKWANASEYTEERINPKQPYFEADFKGAKFIWTDDLDLDNTVIFRTRIEKPGWTPRWNTKPDLDVSGGLLK